MEDRLNTVIREREAVHRSYDQMSSELEKARSKINELERNISDRDRVMQSKRSHFEERQSSQSQEITKLKNNEDSLTTKAVEFVALAEKT